jgi:phage terminase large subunit-like protein
MIAGAQIAEVPDLDRIVVAVDPPVTGGPKSDSCGIVVVGVRMSGPPQSWQAVVLEDATVKGSPAHWAGAVVAAMDRHNADRIVAEVNQGGELVTNVIRSIDPLAPIRTVTATRGKHLRAEPVAALYEQGRVKHLRGLTKLEEQMGKMTAQGWEGTGSPDRLDALVWALTDLMIDPAKGFRAPQVRSL